MLFSTHITTDLERIADYITYLEHGKVVYTGNLEELRAKYRIIKGIPDELTDGMKQQMLGLRQTELGFEALIHTEEVKEYCGFVLDTPTVDDIIIHIGREVKQCPEHLK